MNTYPSLYPVRPSEQFYVAYLRDDQAKEPHWDALNGRFAKRTVASQMPPPTPAIEPGTLDERIERMREWCAERKNRLGIKSEPSFPVGVECADGFTSLNENRKEEVEEEFLARCAGYGARRRKRIRRERTKRLHAPENRRKASATKRTRNARNGIEASLPRLASLRSKRWPSGKYPFRDSLNNEGRGGFLRDLKNRR